MLRKTVLVLSASALLGVVAVAPNAALAFLPPPPVPHLAGPPPVPHLGGPHLGGLPPHAGAPAALGRFGGPAGRPSGLSRLNGRATGYGSGYRSGRYAHSGRGDYGGRHNRGRYSRYGYYGGDGGGSYSDDGCYSTYTSSGRRVTVCDDN